MLEVSDSFEKVLIEQKELKALQQKKEALSNRHGGCSAGEAHCIGFDTFGRGILRLCNFGSASFYSMS